MDALYNNIKTSRKFEPSVKDALLQVIARVQELEKQPGVPGATGPAGPAGPAGPKGPKGSSGK